MQSTLNKDPSTRFMKSLSQVHQNRACKERLCWQSVLQCPYTDNKSVHLVITKHTCISGIYWCEKRKRNEGSHINVQLKLRRMVMGRTTLKILTDVAFGRKERLSRTTYASSDFAVGAHGLFVAVHLLSVTARKKQFKNTTISLSIYQNFRRYFRRYFKSLSFNIYE